MRLIVAAVCCLCLGTLALASPDVTVMIKTRDGVELHTDFDFPLTLDPKNLTAVIDRSPYGQDATERIADVYLLLDMVAVRQDMRGTKRSTGNFTLWHNAANDAYDTMEFISKQSWSNGDIFAVGGSADGIAAFAEILDQPKWLKGQFIIWATSKGRMIIFPGGAFRKNLIEKWLHGTVPNQADGLINLTKSHEAPGPWWNAVNDTGQYPKANFPSLFWAGWYDIFLVGNLIGFNGYQYKSSLPGHSKIVVDPLGHCQKAAKYFPKNVIDGRVALPLLLSLDLFGGNPKSAENVKDVTFYVMGAFDDENAAGHYWTTLDKFPAFQSTNWYIHSDGSLTTSPPASSETEATSYKYDPTNPVPTIGGANLEMACGPLDQRPVENRSDVLVFTSAPLTEATAIVGPLLSTLYVSGSTNDTDFTVKITDVAPDGTSYLLNDGIIRMRWRDHHISNQPVPMKPGVVYEVPVNVWNTSFVFAPGHRIRVDISSSNYPRFDANPNTGLPLLQDGDKPPVIATNTIHHSAKYPSHITLPVVSLSQLPEHGVLKDNVNDLKRFQFILSQRIAAGNYKVGGPRHAAAMRWMKQVTELLAKVTY